MPLIRKKWDNDCEHPGTCNCALADTGVNQSLDELSFARSACAAAQSGDCDKLARILSRDPASVHKDGAGGTSGYTPLHYAARAGHLEALQLLLCQGAVVDALTREGHATALHRAANMGHLAAVQLLLSHGADATLQDADGETALHKAAARGHADTCRVLLAACPGAAQLLERRGRTPSQLAAGEAMAVLAPD